MKLFDHITVALYQCQKEDGPKSKRQTHDKRPPCSSSSRSRQSRSIWVSSSSFWAHFISLSFSLVCSLQSSSSSFCRALIAALCSLARCTNSQPKRSVVKTLMHLVETINLLFQWFDSLMTILQFFFSLFCISEISLRCHNSTLHRRDLKSIPSSQSLVFISPHTDSPAHAPHSSSQPIRCDGCQVRPCQSNPHRFLPQSHPSVSTNYMHLRSLLCSSPGG